MPPRPGRGAQLTLAAPGPGSLPGEPGLQTSTEPRGQNPRPHAAGRPRGRGPEGPSGQVPTRPSPSRLGPAQLTPHCSPSAPFLRQPLPSPCTSNARLPTAKPWAPQKTHQTQDDARHGLLQGTHGTELDERTRVPRSSPRLEKPRAQNTLEQSSQPTAARNARACGQGGASRHKHTGRNTSDHRPD